VQASRSSIEKATFTPFSYRGKGSALRSQKTSCLPSELRLLSDMEMTGGADFTELVDDGSGPLAVRWRDCGEIEFYKGTKV